MGKPAQPIQPGTPFPILSFCGGGIRGVASVSMLNQIYQTYPNVVSGASMIAGTSTGSSITAALATGKKPADLVSLYETVGVLAFLNPGTDATKPAYDITATYKHMHDIYTSDTLDDLGTYVLITSFDVGNANTSWSPVLFNNLPGSATAGTLVAQAVAASCAMPGMYGSMSGVPGFNDLVDGGFVNHDPTLAAIALAVNMGVQLSDIYVLDFGTCYMPNWIVSDTTTWGASQWMAGVSSNGNNPDNTPPLLINGTTSPILNLSLTGTSANIVPLIAGLLLGSRYVYMNPVLPSTDPNLPAFIPENEHDPTIVTALAELAAKEPNIPAAQALVESYWPTT